VWGGGGTSCYVCVNQWWTCHGCLCDVAWRFWAQRCILLVPCPNARAENSPYRRRRRCRRRQTAVAASRRADTPQSGWRRAGERDVRMAVGLNAAPGTKRPWSDGGMGRPRGPRGPGARRSTRANARRRRYSGGRVQTPWRRGVAAARARDNGASLFEETGVNLNRHVGIRGLTIAVHFSDQPETFL